MIWRFTTIEPGAINLKKGHRFEINITEDAILYFTNPVIGRVVVLKLNVSPGVKIIWQNTDECIIRMNDDTYYTENNSDTTEIIYIGFVIKKEGGTTYADCLGMISGLQNIEEL